MAYPIEFNFLEKEVMVYHMEFNFFSCSEANVIAGW